MQAQNNNNQSINIAIDCSSCYILGFLITNIMTQQIKIPDIENCFCGANAKIQTWDIYGEYIYQVVCENKHTLSKYCGSRNRAIHRWNNRVVVKRSNQAGI